MHSSLLSSSVMEGRVGDYRWEDFPGRLVVVSGPSGAGKSSVVRKALDVPGVKSRLSVSVTTRSPRAGEVDGRDYVFVTVDEFTRMRTADALLEWAEVHGNFYGTPAAFVAEQLRDGWCVILEIDVQGALQVQKRIPSALLVFLHAGSLEELEARLRARGSESEPVLQRRLANAREELAFASHYDVCIHNDDLERAVQDFAAVLSRPPSPR